MQGRHLNEKIRDFSFFYAGGSFSFPASFFPQVLSDSVFRYVVKKKTALRIFLGKLWSVFFGERHVQRMLQEHTPAASLLLVQ